MIRRWPSVLPAALLVSSALLPRAAHAADAAPAPAGATAAAREKVAATARSVRFEALDGGRSYEVAVEGLCYEVASGTTIACQRTCRAPCEVTMVPGTYHVRVSGDSSFGAQVEVASSTSVVRIEHRTGPGPLVVALGAATVAAGLWMRAAPLQRCDTASGTCTGTYRNADIRRTGGAVIIGGAVGMAAGAALIATIHDRLVVESPTTAVAQKTTPPRLVGVSLGPTQGGVSAGAGFTF